MTARWIALAMLMTTLAIVGIFLWAVIRPPAPPAEAAAGAPIEVERRLVGPDGAWTLAARAEPRSDRTVALTVSAKDAEGRPLASPASPIAHLRMLDMAMGTERLALVREAPGSWRGAARLSMAGRWSIQVEFGGETLSLAFQAVSL